MNLSSVYQFSYLLHTCSDIQYCHNALVVPQNQPSLLPLESSHLHLGMASCLQFRKKFLLPTLAMTLLLPLMVNSLEVMLNQP